MRLLITGGGTGGHVYPLLAVVQRLAADRVLDPKADIRYIGRKGSIEERIAAEEGIKFAAVRVKGLRTLLPWTFAKNLILSQRAYFDCHEVINNFKPQVVLATGGYVSVPTLWAAARTRTPIVIFLPDLEPGWAIRILSRWARQVAVSFKQVASFFPAGKAIVTGYPVRDSFNRADKSVSREQFQLDHSQNVITIFGGSQGAHSINEAVRVNLAELLNLGQVVHISGPQDEAMLQGHRALLTEKERRNYHLYGYLDKEMPNALAAADLIIARAGAATLGEFPAVGVPSILVPYPFAGRHQESNAAFLVSRGAAVRIADENLAGELLPAVKRLLDDKVRLEEMAKSARALAAPEAAKNIAQLLIQEAQVNVKHVHLIGVGGIGLSAIARVLLSRGLRVSGSDTALSQITQDLVSAGAIVYKGHRAENITPDVDLVVVTSAVSGDNPEVEAASDLGIRVLKRRELLGELTQGYDTIAVAGSHGKTTTTAMIGLILTDAGLDPVVIVGGIVPEFGSNARTGRGRYFVIEADEYDFAFLGLQPHIAVITNVDYDHPDIFPTRADYRAAFVEFAQRISTGGKLIACGDDEGASSIASHMVDRSITYGFGEPNTWRPIDPRQNKEGGTDFEVVRSNEMLGKMSTRLPGRHNVANALAAMAAGDAVGVHLESMRGTLGSFRGVGRRFEIVGEWKGVTIVDDYAHHPAEIMATLSAARDRYGSRELWTVFQPHTFSRTRALLDEFAGSFENADHVIIVQVFAAREHDDHAVSGNDILLKMDHKDARFVSSINEVVAMLSKRLKPGNVLITLGAGDVNRLSRILMEE